MLIIAKITTRSKPVMNIVIYFRRMEIFKLASKIWLVQIPILPKNFWNFFSSNFFFTFFIVYFKPQYPFAFNCLYALGDLDNVQTTVCNKYAINLMIFSIEFRIFSPYSLITTYLYCQVWVDIQG